MIRTDYIQKAQLLDLLLSLDKDFNPPLSDKIDLYGYVDKIIENAILITEVDSAGKVHGIVVLYCNDYITRKGYILSLIHI